MNKRIIMLMLGDVAAAAAALYVGHALRFLRFDSAEEVLAWLPGQLPVFAVTLIVAAYLVELYNADRNLGIKELMVRTFIGPVVSFMIFSILYFFISSISLGRGILGWSLCAFGVLHVLWHIAVQELTSYEGFASRVLILGTGPLALKVRSKEERTLDVSAPSSSSHVSMDAARLLAGLQLIAEERKRQEKGTTCTSRPMTISFG